MMRTRTVARTTTKARRSLKIRTRAIARTSSKPSIGEDARYEPVQSCNPAIPAIPQSRSHPARAVLLYTLIARPPWSCGQEPRPSHRADESPQEERSDEKVWRRVQFAEGRTTTARIDLPLFGLDDAAKEALPKVGVIAHQWRGQYYLVDAVFLNELYLMLPPELRKPTDQPDHDVPPYAKDPTFADIFELDYPTWSDAQLTEREWDAYEACLAVGLGRKNRGALADLYVATATAIRMPSNVRKPYKDHYVSRLLLRHGRFGWLWTEEGLTCRREARSTAADVYRYLATFYPDADADKVNVGLGLITAEKPDGEAEPTDEATEVEVDVEDGACGIALPGLHLG